MHRLVGSVRSLVLSARRLLVRRRSDQRRAHRGSESATARRACWRRRGRGQGVEVLQFLDAFFQFDDLRSFVVQLFFQLSDLFLLSRRGILHCPLNGQIELNLLIFASRSLGRLEGLRLTGLFLSVRRRFVGLRVDGGRHSVTLKALENVLMFTAHLFQLELEVRLQRLDDLRGLQVRRSTKVLVHFLQRRVFASQLLFQLLADVELHLRREEWRMKRREGGREADGPSVFRCLADGWAFLLGVVRCLVAVLLWSVEDFRSVGEDSAGTRRADRVARRSFVAFRSSTAGTPWRSLVSSPSPSRCTPCPECTGCNHPRLPAALLSPSPRTTTGNERPSSDCSAEISSLRRERWKSKDRPGGTSECNERGERDRRQWHD